MGHKGSLEHAGSRGAIRPHTIRAEVDATERVTVRQVEELARAHTEEAIATLAEIMATNSKRVSAATRVSAARALLDYGWGRPGAAQQGRSAGPITLVIQGFGKLEVPAGNDPPQLEAGEVVDVG